MIPNIWKNKVASVVSPTAAAFQTSAATLSHETRFERVSNTFFLRVWWVRRQPFRTDEVRVSKTGGFSYILGGNPFARNEVRASRTAGFCDFTSSAATFSHETSKIFINLHVPKHPYNQYRQNVTYIRGGPETRKTSSTAHVAGGSFRDRAL